MSPADRSAVGHVAWELLDTATGEVRTGRREVRAVDVEVMVTPPRPPPTLARLRREPPLRLIADGLGRLFTGGRATTTKRLLLGRDLWLVLPEQPGPDVPPGVGLKAELDGERTFCWEWFEVGDDGVTATQRQETGTLGLEWARTPDGLREVVGTTFTTDVGLRLRAPNDGSRSEPRWRLRVLAGSVVPWPRSSAGIQLVPRLRPDHPRVRPDRPET